MKSSSAGCVFHLVAVLGNAYFDKFVYSDLMSDIFSASEIFRDNMFVIVPQFATFWSQFVVQIYFLFSFFDDVLSSTRPTFYPEQRKKFNEHVSNLFTCYAFPFSIVMSVNFWALCYNGPALVDEFDLMYHVFDQDTNHMVHTYVIAILFAELLLTRRRYPRTATVAYPYIKITWALATYFTTVFAMKLISPIWPYPYFKAMSALQWTAYILVNLLLTYCSYLVGYFCSSLRWGQHPKARENIMRILTPSWARFVNFVYLFEHVGTRSVKQSHRSLQEPNSTDTGTEVVGSR